MLLNNSRNQNTTWGPQILEKQCEAPGKEEEKTENLKN